MATGPKAGLYQNAQSPSYLPPTLEDLSNLLPNVIGKTGFITSRFQEWYTYELKAKVKFFFKTTAMESQVPGNLKLFMSFHPLERF